MRKGLWLSILLLALVLILPTACKAPAEFEVISLDIAPPQVTAGETVSVTSEVRNTGGSEGVYTAVLTVDGVEAEKKDITVAPGATETVTFTMVKDKAGTYQIAIGERSSSLTVKPKLVAKEIELKYDDGKADGYLVSVSGGWLVDFKLPVIPFTVQKIRLFGSRSLESGIFEIEIWDKDRKVLYKEAYPRTKFPESKSLPTKEVLPEGGAWVELEVPKIEVADKFYVHMWNGPTSFGGIHLGADFSAKNEHSAITARTTEVTKVVESWTPGNFCLCWSVVDWAQSRTNWMIRVVGTAMVPEE
jgi:hypothetical protein